MTDAADSRGSTAVLPAATRQQIRRSTSPLQGTSSADASLLPDLSQACGIVVPWRVLDLELLRSHFDR